MLVRVIMEVFHNTPKENDFVIFLLIMLDNKYDKELYHKHRIQFNNVKIVYPKGRKDNSYMTSFDIIH